MGWRSPKGKKKKKTNKRSSSSERTGFGKAREGGVCVREVVDGERSSFERVCRCMVTGPPECKGKLGVVK